MTKEEELKKIIRTWYNKQIDCQDREKAEESMEELYLNIKEFLKEKKEK